MRYAVVILSLLILFAALARVSQTGEPQAASIQQASAGGPPIRVIYIQTQNKEPDGPVDIFEKDLSTGSNKLLISHSSLPRATDMSIKASPDGRYLALVWDGDYASLDPVTKIPGRIHVWDRKSKKLSLILKKYDFHQVCWSPNGHSLLFFDPYDGSEFSVYNALSGDLEKFTVSGDIQDAIWSVKGTDIIYASGKGKSTVYLQPISGKRQTLFRWPAGIQNIAQSPGGSYAIYDARDVYLADSKGAHPRRLHIPVKRDDPFGVDLAFNRDGSRLAILTSHSYGEPHINMDQDLWSADTKTGKLTKIASWSESYLNISPLLGTYTTRSIEGWLPDGKSVLISSQITWGGEGVAENRSDWFDLCTYDPDSRKERKIFDSGPGCLNITLWLDNSPTLNFQP